MKKIKLNEKDVLEKYQENGSLRITSKYFGVSVSPIQRILNNNNIIKNSSRKYTCDFDFFEKIDTEEKAYWLGFLYADGYVRTRKRLGGFCLSSELKLKIIDREHLERFNQSLKGNYPITKVKGTNCWQISICHLKMVNDLVSKGCVSKKSLILTFPNELILPKKLQSHFIRGYFDGDGSISFTLNSKTLRKQKSLSLVGTFNFLSQIQSIFENHSIKSSLVKYKAKNVYYVLYCQSYQDIFQVFEFLYSSSKIFLKRKEIIFTALKKSYYQLKHHICKKCGEIYEGHHNSTKCSKCKEEK